MLEGLDDVPWAKLRHALGPADDVPDLVRDLASDDDERRAKAQYDLYGTLWSHGTVYEATPHAIPFLVEILEHAEYVDRPWLLIYLSALANGASHHEVHQLHGIYDEERDTAEFAAKIAQDQSWVDGAKRAVRKGLPTYQRLLSHDDPATRASAAFLLGGLRDDAPTTIAVLSGRLASESVPVVRASVAEALGTLGDEPLTRVRLLDLVEHDNAPYVRWAAARSLAFLAADDVDDAVVEALVFALKDPSSIEPLHAESPWAEENTPAATARALLAVGPDKGARAVPALAKMLAGSDPSSALAIAETLLGLAFDTSEPARADFDDLDSTQQLVVRTLAHSDAAWMMGGNMSSLLDRHRLPRSASSLQTFAGIATRRVGADTLGGLGPGDSMSGATIPRDWLD
ncbi:MAG: HEAT repeat domain-containing protein [Nannocystaceae bacterium]|nr:HEAT repeat domain-containing protein [bacterium]